MTKGHSTNGEEKTEDKDNNKAETKDESKEENKEESKEDKKEEKKKYEPKGTVCDTHNLYETKPDESGNVSWTKDYPESLVAPAEDEESAQYALIVRHSKCYDGRKSLKIHSIVVQSEPLKEFLGKVLENYPGVTTTLERLEFYNPFKPLVHRWEQFIEFREKLEDSEDVTKKHVDLLYKVGFH